MFLKTIESKCIYDLSAMDSGGNEVSLSTYKGKVLMIVNTATACGYTRQLGELQKIYEKYHSSGFEILAFPSNDFGEQEPLPDKAIESFCKKEYGVTYPVFSKIKVRGDNAHPLFQFLSKKSLNGKVNSKPLWNFHKYLIDRKGMVRDYWYTIVNPNSNKITGKIEKLLNEPD